MKLLTLFLCLSLTVVAFVSSADVKDDVDVSMVKFKKFKVKVCFHRFNFSRLVFKLTFFLLKLIESIQEKVQQRSAVLVLSTLEEQEDNGFQTQSGRFARQQFLHVGGQPVCRSSKGLQCELCK